MTWLRRRMFLSHDGTLWVQMFLMEWSRATPSHRSRDKRDPRTAKSLFSI